MLWTDLRHDFVQTRVRPLDETSLQHLDAWFEPMERNGRSVLKDEGSLPSDMMLLRSVDVRYFGQEYTVTVPVSSRSIRWSDLSCASASMPLMRNDTGTQILMCQRRSLRCALAAIGNVAEPELSAFRGHSVESAVAPKRAPGLFRERPRHGRDACHATRELSRRP